MKQLLILGVSLLLVLAACAPAQAPEEPVVPSPKEPKVVTQEEVTQPPQEEVIETVQYEGAEEEVSPGPTSEETYAVEPYTQLGCEQLLTASEFASMCGQEEAMLVVTYKVGTRNCFVNVKQRENERLTAGVTLTKYEVSGEAKEEFERRMDVLNVDAVDTVGERSYEFPKVDRQTINFLRDAFIVEVGSDTRLCAEDKLLDVAKKVDERIR